MTAFGAVGAMIVVAIMLDVVWTTIAVGGGRGVVANAVGWKVASLGRLGSPGHRRLQIVGVLVAAAIPATWLLLVWGGFSLIFLADTSAVVDSVTQKPTSALGRIAFAAGGLAGAGAGLIAATPGWQLVNNLSAIVGLILVTLSLTYLLQVVNAVAAERATFSQVSALGSGPVDAVLAALPAPGLGTLPLQVVTIANGISQAAQDHLTLPVLQFFHSPDRDSAAAVNLARFDETITVLDAAQPSSHEPTVRAGRDAVDSFLATLRLGAHNLDAPPPPTFAGRESPPGLGADSGQRLADAAAAQHHRRARLRAFVEQEGWSWGDVTSP